LYQAKSQLNKAGQDFEQFDMIQDGSHQLADMFSVGKIDDAKRLLRGLRTEFTNLIISSENFSRLNEGQVRSFLSFFDVKSTKVVYYLRNPLKRLYSAGTEKVKHGYRYTFVEFIAGRLARPFRDTEINDDLKIKPWVNVLGLDKLDIHLYDRIDDVVDHFLALYCPSNIQLIKSGSRANTSFNATKVEVYRALAGYQWHLSGCRDFDEKIGNLCSELNALSQSRSESYLREFSIAPNNIVLDNLERSLVDNYSRSISDEIKNRRLYDKEEVVWKYFSPDVWFENPEMMMKLFEIRKEIHDQLGEPKFDKRLRAI
jgi:hypothetical protein